MENLNRLLAALPSDEYARLSPYAPGRSFRGGAGGGALRHAFHQYWQALLTQAVACNALHDVQARCETPQRLWLITSDA